MAINPVVNFALFSERAYTIAVLVAMIQSLALFAVNFLIVFYMIGVQGYDPLTAAFLLIPLPIMIAVIAPLSGWVSDRFGARIPTTLGLLIQTAALIFFLQLGQDTSYLQIAAGLALMGLGGGMFFPSNTSSAMSASQKESLGVASATLSTFRQTGMVTSFALSLAVAASSLPRDIALQLFVGTNIKLGSEITKDFIIGLHGAFIVSIVLCLFAAVISLIRGNDKKTRPSRGIED